jgi:hypothetical protein
MNVDLLCPMANSLFFEHSCCCTTFFKRYTDFMICNLQKAVGQLTVFFANWQVAKDTEPKAAKQINTTLSGLHSQHEMCISSFFFKHFPAQFN